MCGSEGSCSKFKPKEPLISSSDSFACLDTAKRPRRRSIKERDMERLLGLRWKLVSGMGYDWCQNQQDHATEVWDMGKRKYKRHINITNRITYNNPESRPAV